MHTQTQDCIPFYHPASHTCIPGKYFKTQIFQLSNDNESFNIKVLSLSTKIDNCQFSKIYNFFKINFIVKKDITINS